MIHCLDAETFLLTRSMPAPQSVCWAHDDGNGAQLYLPDQAYPVLRGLLRRGDQWVNHNTTYDAAVACVEAPDFLPLVFDGFDSGQIRCTMIREQLIRISRGEGRFVVVADDEEADEEAKLTRTRFDLGATSWRWLRHFVNKKDYWRTRYALLYGKPLEEWPQEAKDYPLEDARVTRRVYLAQQQYIDSEHGGSLPDEIPQHSYAWALKLVQLWGVRTQRETVERLKEKLTKRQAETIAALLPKGLFWDKNTPGVSKRTGKPLPRRRPPEYAKRMSVIREKVSRAYSDMGEEVPLTKKKAVRTATQVLRESNDKDLRLLADAMGAMKLLKSFIPVLESGVNEPICADYNVLVESGRTSCRKPNMQQLPRGLIEKDAAGNVTAEYYPREAFIARARKAWVSVDYEMAELVGQGQMCLDIVGSSVLAEQINAGQKPIMAFVANTLGMTYEQAIQGHKSGDKFIKKRRQDGKKVMYGLPGGMKPKKLWQTMIADEADVTLAEARQYERQWQSVYPEFPKFFDYVKSQVGAEYGDTGTIVQLRSGRIRGGADYPAACNTFFQGLVADAAKSALRDVVRECYLVSSSPLYGSRVVVFAHDEIIVECDEDKVHAVGYRIAEIMKAAAKRFMPDVHMGAEPAAMKRWVKDCPPTFRNNELVVTM